MAKRRLTDRTIKALKPAKAGGRYDVMDDLVTGFGVRVTEKGQKTFILVARYPGSTNPTRSALSPSGAITLEAARNKARDWIELIRKGIDPRKEEQRERETRAVAGAHTFAVLAEEFIAKDVIGPNPDQPRQRKAETVVRAFRTVFIPLWGERPIGEIDRSEIRSVIEDVRDYGTAKMLAKRGIKLDQNGRGARRREGPAPAHARNLLGLIKQFFTWAVDRLDDKKTKGVLPYSPCASLSARRILGEKTTGARVLSDDELFAFWRAVDRLPYPYRPAYQLLALTALRLNEAVGAAWGEFNVARGEWVIPAARMKGKNGKARTHAVPLTDDILATLSAVPRFEAGPFLFSTTLGKKPVRLGDKVKKRIDARMLRTLRALARRRGEDPRSIELANWTNHDIRRTVRSQLSRLKIAEETREAVLAHVPAGIKGVYDHHEYFDEKRDALEQWARRLRSIVTPPPENVVSIETARA